ncbi:glycine zipper 2TM domain-containing protein [Sphingomonas solaris]|uniref:17 kDa surface antigen n=1 Tax=Alterirhizorhabdus solaris TaxID=2529389 RepID=A0A558R717_9SPHN|nr:glycine zipper 2TM domain-containing protein [Sphingomonas solaris]TVV75171.1 glycine zipper 2TM domain-containing protein [Sphingomonas solaris]
MKTHLLALALATLPALATPVLAQSASDEQRWEQAQARYRAETDRYYTERDLYYDTRARRPGDRYGAAPSPGGYDDRFATDYDAARDYRDDPRYRERQLSTDDQVYRGSDGRYYCKRNDGTTGLILGAAGGGILGNVIDGGRRRTGGTLIGGALGALLGRSVDQNGGAQSQDVRCR